MNYSRVVSYLSAYNLPWYNSQINQKTQIDATGIDHGRVDTGVETG